MAEPQRRFSYSIHAGADQPRTYVTWEIVEAADESGSRVRLYVDETEIASHDDDEAGNTWLLVIASLQRALSSLPVE